MADIRGVILLNLLSKEFCHMIFKKKYNEISIGGKYFQRSAQRRTLLASKYVDLKDLVISNSYFFSFLKTYNNLHTIAR